MHIEFRSDLGAKVLVDVPDERALEDTLRRYGRLGWTSGEVPPGGYPFPYDNFSDFDWSLIGARKWTHPEGDVLVIHRGQAYKIRDLEAVDSRKMKLPAAVKISRGAKSTDPEHVREKADGEFEYVTLPIFRGASGRSAPPCPGKARQPPTPPISQRQQRGGAIPRALSAPRRCVQPQSPAS